MLPAPMLVAAASSGDHGAYVGAVTAHAVAALVAFGGIGVTGVYAHTAAHLERPGALDEARRWFGGRNWALFVLPAVPVLGVLALVAGGHPGRITQGWVIAALALWCLVTALAWVVIRPAEATVRRLLAEVPGGAGGPEPVLTARPALQSAARRLGRVAGVCDVAFVVALGLMIWQPG